MLAGDRTPPAWDPLGVAPFAWDLPDPTPLPEPPVGQQQRSGRSALSRAFVGIALLAGAMAAVGVIAGWWALSWAEVSAIALAVVGVGLILAALRGRGRPLIGPGIFLALLTLALTVTGVNGTQNYGGKVWTPASVAEIDNQTFTWNAVAANSISPAWPSRREPRPPPRWTYAPVRRPSSFRPTSPCMPPVRPTSAMSTA